MSLAQICSEICKKSEYREKFSELKNEEKRIKYAYDICKNYVSNLNFKRVFKNDEKSSALSLQAIDTRNKNQLWEGLKLATESIAYAREKESLACGYKARSNILFSLEYYSEVSCDLLHSLDLVHDEELKEKGLLHYETLSKQQSTTSYLMGSGDAASLTNGSSSYFESASKSVGLKHTNYYERQLTAENDIKTGEVLIVEKPYASVLLPSHFYTHCSNCFKRCLNLLPCSGCCFSMFCSKQCETKSLENSHNIECSIMDILTDLKVERMELLSLRILIYASKQGKSLQELHEQVCKHETEMKNNNKNNISNNQTYKSSDFMNIYNLVTNSGKRSIFDLLYRCTVSSVLVYLLSKHTKFFSFIPASEKEFFEEFCVGLVYRFMQSLPCNAHEVSEMTFSGLSEIGAGIYATLSLINHSCDPNVVRYSCGDLIVLRAIKPIKKDEQILDNYGYHYATHSLSERQTSLMKQYYFKCECEACTAQWPEYHSLPQEKVQLKKNADVKLYTKLTQKFEINLKNTLNGNFNSKTLEEFTKYLDYLHESVVLPWQNFNNCQEAIKHCWSFEGNHFRKSKAIIS